MGKQENCFTFHFCGIKVRNLYSQPKLVTYFNIANTNITPNKDEVLRVYGFHL